MKDQKRKMAKNGLEAEQMFQNHQISYPVQGRRDQLKEQWKDSEIHDCTYEAALRVLFYKILEHNSKLGYPHIGKTIVFWDRQHVNLLHFASQEETYIVDRKLDILPDGTLHYDGLFYRSPQRFLDTLTQAKHLIYKRIEINPEKGLDVVLRGALPNDFEFNYPPDYPPLLFELALSNDDFATADKILAQHFNQDETSDKHNQKRKNILQTAILSAIANRHINYFDHLLVRYDLLNPENLNFLEPIISAVKLNHRKLTGVLFKRYPVSQLTKVGSEAILVAVEHSSQEFVSWLLDYIESEVPLKIDKSKQLKFYTSLIYRFNGELVKKIIERIKPELAWKEIIESLVKLPGHPEFYLQLFKTYGGQVAGLDNLLQVQLLQKAIEERNASEPLKKFLKDHSEFKVHLDEALLLHLNDDEAVKTLLELGAKPSEKHFETLLRITDFGTERQRKFLRLLAYVESLDDAKSNLPIVSAYGEEAMSAVMMKFPELSQDQEFLLKLLNNTWKGAIIAAEKSASDMVTIGKISNASEDGKALNELSSPVDRELPINMGSAITMEILIDIMLPSKQFDKICSLLVQKPELIYEFWWRCLFAYEEDFIGPEWETLAKVTQPFLDDDKKSRLLLYFFRFFNKPLATLWIRCYQNLTDQNVIESFILSLAAGDTDVVDILADIGKLEVMGDVGNSLLLIAINENCLPFVHKLLEKGADSTKGNLMGMRPYESALSQQKISICLVLQKDCLDEIASSLSTLEPKDLEQNLIKAFLNSNSQDVLSLLEKIENLNLIDLAYRETVDRVRKFIINSGTLIVRYPRPQEQHEVHCGYNTGQATYEEMQYSWGTRCEELYQELYAEFLQQEMGLLEVLMKFANKRSDSQGYTVWRMGYYNEGIGLITYFHWRYFIYWHLAIKIYKQLSLSQKSFEGLLRKNITGYEVLYIPNEKESIVLTKIEIRKPFFRGLFRARIVHTFPFELKKIIPHLSKLFDAIKNYPKDLSKQSIPPDLKKMIALFFWLGIHNTITERGNSQYMLMLHRLLYNIHGFQTGPWNPLYVQPDCIALLMPFEQFYEQFYDQLFDYAPIKL